MSKQQHILVVDDDPGVVEAVSMKLNSLNFRTSKAYDGVEAYEKIRQDKPDLVILDVMMPR
ncbi:MAG: response regulator, partial [Desulforhabdus sp.]|nr:response regulator [Desulforhabdus sp.]